MYLDSYSSDFYLPHKNAAAAILTVYVVKCNYDRNVICKQNYAQETRRHPQHAYAHSLYTPNQPIPIS